MGLKTSTVELLECYGNMMLIGSIIVTAGRAIIPLNLDRCFQQLGGVGQASFKLDPVCHGAFISTPVVLGLLPHTSQVDVRHCYRHDDLDQKSATIPICKIVLRKVQAELMQR